MRHAIIQAILSCITLRQELITKALASGQAFAKVFFFATELVNFPSC